MSMDNVRYSREILVEVDVVGNHGNGVGERATGPKFAN